MGAGPGSLWAGLGKRRVGKALEPGQRQERLGNSWAVSNLSDQSSLVEENVQSVSRMGMPLQVLCLLNWGLGSQTLSQPRNSLKERPQAVFFFFNSFLAKCHAYQFIFNRSNLERFSL